MLAGKWPSCIEPPPLPYRESGESDEEYRKKLVKYKAMLTQEVIKNYRWAVGEVLKLTPKYHLLNQHKKVTISIADLVSDACDSLIPALAKFARASGTLPRSSSAAQPEGGSLRAMPFAPMDADSRPLRHRQTYTLIRGSGAAGLPGIVLRHSRVASHR